MFFPLVNAEPYVINNCVGVSFSDWHAEQFCDGIFVTKPLCIVNRLSYAHKLFHSLWQSNFDGYDFPYTINRDIYRVFIIYWNGE